MDYACNTEGLSQFPVLLLWKDTTRINGTARKEQEKKLFWEGYNSCIFGVSHKNKIETLAVQQILHVTALAYLVGEF